MSYNFTRIKWNKLAENHLFKACEKDRPEHYIKLLRDEVEREETVLLKVTNKNGDCVCFITLRDELTETVLLAAGGEEKGVVLYPRVYPLLEGLLRSLGVKRLRVDVMRSGAAFWLKRFGYKEIEDRTFRKDLV